MSASAGRPPRRIASFLLLSLLGGGVLVAPSAHADSDMPPGAFLHNPVSDVAALDRELRDDSVASERYSRLLRLSPARVRATFAHLHLTRLLRDMVMEVHYVHPGERIGAKLRRVRKGTAVFALPNGIPVLAQVCGNPLRDIRSAKKRGSVSRPFSRKRSRQTMPEDVPDFDPSEPLDDPMIADNGTLAMHGLIPATLLLPDQGSLLFSQLGRGASVTPEPAVGLFAAALITASLAAVRRRRRGARR